MNSFVSLAKTAVENYIKKGEIISLPKNFPQKFLNNQAGVFVTIEKQIHLACQKAGIDLEKEKFLIYRFTTTRQKE